MERQQPALTAAEQRKKQKDAGRPRHGNLQHKRVHVLLNPAKLAFRGWEAASQPWTLATCEQFIEWCHIGKLFPLHRHKCNRQSNKANMKYCKNRQFGRRCLEVWQVLYNQAMNERNEVPLFICRMVYAEVVLHRQVDWRTIRLTPSVQRRPHEMAIPTGVLRFPGVDWAYLDDPEDQAPVDWSDSGEDNDSDGTVDRPPQSQTRGATSARITRLKKKDPMLAACLSTRNRAPPANPTGPGIPHQAPPAIVGGSSNVDVAPPILVPQIAGPSNVDVAPHVLNPQIAGPSNVMEDDDTGFADELEATIAAADAQGPQGDALQKELEGKNAIISEMEKTIQNLYEEADRMNEIIRKQNEEISQLRSAKTPTYVPEASQALIPGSPGMNEEDVNAIIESATHGLLEDTPVRVPRKPIIPFASSSQVMHPPQRQIMFVDSQETEDSLGFQQPSVPTVSELQATNGMLRKYLIEMSRQYYQWKIACIMNVDRFRQMHDEFKRIDRDYLQLNSKRDFGLTSWADPDEMFPDSLPMIGKAIDWTQLEWEYKTAISNEKIAKNAKPSLLWPNPAKYVLDGTECPVCCNVFGLEGGWQLGSCQCMYHPQCLISHALIRRKCAVCKAPLHKRFYEQFGLVNWMPPHWELNKENTPDFPDKWGEDLIWNWLMGMHQSYVKQMSDQWRWDQKPAEIVRICHELIKGGTEEELEGRRNFFYQVLHGYWDIQTCTFQYGPHPLGFKWNSKGELVADQIKELHDMTAEDFRIAEEVQTAESEWDILFKNQAVDFLCAEVAPEVVTVLRRMRNNNFMEAMLGGDGIAKRTRSAKRKLIANDGAESSAAGTSRARHDEGGSSSSAPGT